MKGSRWLYLGALALALAIGFGGFHPLKVKASPSSTATPTFQVDPTWPKPLPATVYPAAAPYTPNDKLSHMWVSGEIAGSCVDQNGHVYTFNRGWEVGIVPPGSPTGTTAQGSESGAIDGEDATASAIPSPPVVAYDQSGNVVDYFGDPTLIANPMPNFGAAEYLPQGAHGCFVDYRGNIWVGGNGDGIVQKYSLSEKGTSPNGYPGAYKLQIGTKGMCDGTAASTPAAVFPTCNETNDNNTSHTLLNEPADIAVDPDPDPVTNQPGDIYIADGYGNHRVVVFDANGNYLRQWGTSCGMNSINCPGGTFGATGGGHPHCVVLGNDGMIYVCDRPNSRIQVFAKNCGSASTSSNPQPTCTPVRIIPINNFPSASAANQASILAAGTRACDMDFWPNVDYLASKSPTDQHLVVDVDLGNDNTWILDKASGITIGALGRCGMGPCPGHQIGEFGFGHTTTVDPSGNIYVAETITGRRIQRFVQTGGGQ